MSKPRVSLTIVVDGRVSWRERTARFIVGKPGKKAIVTMPEDVVAEATADGRKLRIGVTIADIYDTPTWKTLDTARRALLAFAAPDLRPLFEGAMHLERSWQAWSAYEGELVDAGLERAAILRTQYDGDRARCPFCGDWPAAPGPTSGFAYPIGLTMHLEGSGNARKCVVVEALMDWARERL